MAYWSFEHEPDSDCRPLLQAKLNLPAEWILDESAVETGVELHLLTAKAFEE